MTLREIYEKNKEIYDSEAVDYINEFLSNIGDIAYLPFVLKSQTTQGVSQIS